MHTIFFVKLYCFLLATLLPLFSFSQNIDSLETELKNTQGKEKVTILNKMADYYLFENLDKSLEYSDEALHISKKNNDSTFLAASYLRMGYALRYQSKYQAALDSLYQTVPMIEQLNEQMQTDILNLIGLLHQDLRHDTISTQNFIQEIESNQDPGYINKNMQILSKLATYYETKENYQKALSYLAKYAVFQSVAGDTAGVVFTLNRISGYYNKMDLNAEALRYANIALERATSGNHPDSLRGEILENIGTFYLENNQLEEAIDAFKNSYRIAKSIKQSNALSDRALLLGKIYAGEGIHDTALKFFREAYIASKENQKFLNTAEVLLESAKSDMALAEYSKALEKLKEASGFTDENELEIKAKICKTFAELYKHLGNNEKSLSYLQQHIKYNDSLHKKDKEEALSRLHSNYEVDKKEQRIETLQMDSRISALELEKRKAKITSLVTGLTGLIIVVVLIIILYTNKIRTSRVLALQNHQIKEQNEELNIINERLSEAEKRLKKSNATKDKFFSIIAHDVKNPLNAFRSIIYSIKNSKEKKKRNLTPYLDELDYYSLTTIDLLNNLLLWARSQEEDIEPEFSKINLKGIIDKAVREQNNSLQKKEITVNVPDKELTILSDKNMVDFIIRNLLSNAIKFSNSGENINIEIKKQQQDVLFRITDEGVGMKPNILHKLNNKEYVSTEGTNKEKGAGVGLTMCQYFLEKIRGTMKIFSSEGKGTRIEILLTNATV